MSNINKAIRYRAMVIKLLTKYFRPDDLHNMDIDEIEVKVEEIFLSPNYKIKYGEERK